MQYATRTIEKAIEARREGRKESHCQDRFADLSQWLAEIVQAREDDGLARLLHSLGSGYADKADSLLALEREMAGAKGYYHLAAQAHALCYQLKRAGARWQVGSAGGPYDFRKNNFNFSKNAILANAPELALTITGEDTIEGMLVAGDYELARRSLPREPSGMRDGLGLCRWGIAHGDQQVLDQGLQERIKVLRRQGRSHPVILDSWGLAAVQLARHRGMRCQVPVIELPWDLLDDTPADLTGLTLPMAEEIRSIIREKTSGGTI